MINVPGVRPLSLLLAALLGAVVAPDVPAQPIVRVSVATDGTQADGSSAVPSISGDGRYVAFQSFAENLTPGDSTGLSSAFVRDTAAKTTTRLSAGEFEEEPVLSESGRFVVFSADPAGADEERGIYLYDLVEHYTERVSVNNAGQAADGHCENPAISRDGRFVIFIWNANNLDPRASNDNWQLFLRDRTQGTTSLLTVDRTGGEANDESGNADFSADGRYIAFQSWASDLVAGDFNDALDVFVRDTVNGTTVRASVPDPQLPFEFDADSGDPSISEDGRYVAFESDAASLVPGDTNGRSDIFVRDMQTGVTTRVSVSSGGAEANGASYRPSLSSDGRYVAFESSAANLVPGHSGSMSAIYAHDMQTGATICVSDAPNGTPANAGSEWPSMSRDGRFVVFQSSASNLVPGDTNEQDDIFLSGPITFAPVEYTLADAATALRIGAGLLVPTPDQSTRLNVEASAGVDLHDAVSIARTAAALDASG